MTFAQGLLKTSGGRGVGLLPAARKDLALPGQSYSVSNSVKDPLRSIFGRSFHLPKIGSAVNNSIAADRRASTARNASSKSVEPHNILTEDMVHELENKFLAFFNAKDIDGWDIRQGITDLLAEDMIPSPKLITAILEACRRVNDYAMTTRFLEAVHNKTGQNDSTFQWLMEQVRPTLDKYGISTPAELGYDKPELWMEDLYERH